MPTSSSRHASWTLRFRTRPARFFCALERAGPIPWARISAIFKADGVETGDRYSISEWWLEPHTQGPGAHSHPEDDVFYVIEGTMLSIDGRMAGRPARLLRSRTGGRDTRFREPGRRPCGCIEPFHSWRLRAAHARHCSVVCRAPAGSCRRLIARFRPCSPRRHDGLHASNGGDRSLGQRMPAYARRNPGRCLVIGRRSDARMRSPRRPAIQPS